MKKRNYYSIDFRTSLYRKVREEYLDDKAEGKANSITHYAMKMNLKIPNDMALSFLNGEESTSSFMEKLHVYFNQAKITKRKNKARESLKLFAKIFEDHHKDWAVLLDRIVEIKIEPSERCLEQISTIKLHNM